MKRNHKGFSILEIMLFVLVLGVVIAVGIHELRSLENRRNNDYFNSLSAHTKTYYLKQAEAMGLEPTDKDLVKSCYRTEQGPFDNGHLWCGIRVAKMIKIEPDEAKLQDLVDKLKATVKSQGFDVAIHGSVKLGGNFQLDAGIGDGLSPKLCSVLVNYPSYSTYDKYSRYFKDESVLDYNLNCANRSSGIVPGFGR